MNTPTIIIVEDELIIAMDLKRILLQEGYNVIINFKNYNLIETIYDIEKYNPVLVILDVNLQQKLFDGVTIAQNLLVKDMVPFIFITGNSSKEMVERIKTARPHGIIIKPFKPIDVTCTVAVVIHNYVYKDVNLMSLDKKIPKNIPFILKPVIEYIEENIDRRIDTRVLADLTNYNYMHFIRTFSLFMDVTPYQYILQKKIEKAKRLIIETDHLLTHIAFDLSFSSYSNFCTVFKRLTGQTPDAFRKTNSAKKYFNR